MIDSGIKMLEVIGSNKHGKRIARFQCFCGKEFNCVMADINSGNTKSCGCLKIGKITKHGMYKTRTYRIWQSMLNRCRQKQYEKYYSGITVCEEWKSFENFIADMGECPDGLSIDRINNNDGYYKENCRWATMKTQTRNTRRRVEFDLNGVKMSLIEWAEFIGIPFERLRARIRYGWRFEDAIAKK